MPTARTPSRLRSWWPAVLVLWLAPAVLYVFVDEYAMSGAVVVLTGLVPTVVAAALVGRMIGGRRGWAAFAGLMALAAYWAWWFGWGVDYNISPFSFDQAASGLIAAPAYHLGLAILLWPLVLGAALITALVARWRRWRVWPSIGVLVLVMVVAAFPRGAEWSDGCNSGDGASPLLTKPVATSLMDAGVGVIPAPSQTLMLCENVGDRSWKPFWLGHDGLPALPLVQSTSQAYRMPRALFRPPTMLPGGRLPRVAVARARARRSIHVVVALDQRLSALRSSPNDDGRPGVDRDVRLLGVQRDRVVDESRGPRGWCYEFMWYPDTHRSQRLATVRAGDRVPITLQYRGKVMGRTEAQVGEILKRADYAALRRRFGCDLEP